MWAGGAAGDPTLAAPALLRFASDTFMDDLARLLDTRPGDIAAQVAQPITFRDVAPRAASDPVPALDHLKLYQPAHGDFYLVAASLVCAIPGLPDRGADTAAGDRAVFVLRRLAGGTELAWVDDPRSRTGRSWMPIADTVHPALAQGEDLMPLFPTHFVQGGEKRRLLVGYIPTASKESYVASELIDPRPVQPADTRFDALELRVIAALQQLREDADAGGTGDRNDASRFVLLELAALLVEGTPELWTALAKAERPADAGAAQTLYDTLENRKWRAALVAAWAQRRDIEGESGTVPALDVDLGRLPLGGDAASDAGLLRTQVQAVLAKPVSGAPAAVARVPVPKLDPRGAAHYVLRCAYLRPQCGALHRDVVSAPSEEFAIADFFDFDAPARDIQIVLPADTSVKDLRKFQRNVRFVISDQLRHQLNRAGKLGLIPGAKQTPDEPLSVGWICTMSIPIITICALIALFIFLIILNVIFWWLPFVKVCLPVPMKAK
jgi:hypothetical protein